MSCPYCLRERVPNYSTSAKPCLYQNGIAPSRAWRTMPLAFVTRRHSSTAWPPLRARDIFIVVCACFKRQNETNDWSTLARRHHQGKYWNKSLNHKWHLKKAPPSHPFALRGSSSKDARISKLLAQSKWHPWVRLHWRPPKTVIIQELRHLCDRLNDQLLRFRLKKWLQRRCAALMPEI